MAGVQIFFAIVLVTVSGVNSECEESQLNQVKLQFKDCMEEKKADLLQIGSEGEGPELATALICQGLKELSTGCGQVVDDFSMCKSREHVRHLIAIHLNAITEILSPFHPEVDLKACPVFQTPAPPTIVKHSDGVHHIEPEPISEPEYEPITGAAGMAGPKTLLPAAVVLSALLLLG